MYVRGLARKIVTLEFYRPDPPGTSPTGARAGPTAGRAAFFSSSPSPAPMSITQNRKARYDYQVEERFEAGLVLEGWEVKSIRAGRIPWRDLAGLGGR